MMCMITRDRTYNVSSCAGSKKTLISCIFTNHITLSTHIFKFCLHLLNLTFLVTHLINLKFGIADFFLICILKYWDSLVFLAFATLQLKFCWIHDSASNKWTIGCWYENNADLVKQETHASISYVSEFTYGLNIYISVRNILSQQFFGWDKLLQKIFVVL